MQRRYQAFVPMSVAIIVALSLSLLMTSIAGAGGYEGSAEQKSACEDPCEIIRQEIERRGIIPGSDAAALLAVTCDRVKTLGNYTLRFRGVDNDPGTNTSLWFYTLEWDGELPQLESFVIGTGDCIVRATVITACPAGYTVGFHASEGIYGLRWTVIPAIRELRISILLNGFYEVGEVPFIVKAGGEVRRGTICGVICEDECELSIECPPDITIECDDPKGPEFTGTPAISGTCPPYEVTYADTSIPGSCPHQYTLERTWEVTDSEDNFRTCTQLIHVDDTTPPTVTCAPDDTVECNEVVVYPDPVVTDNCDPNPIVRAVSSVTPVPERCEEIYEVCWVAEDACGNVSESCCQTIVRPVDTEPPVLSCATMGIIGCNEPVVFIEPLVTDNCDLDPELRIISTTVEPGPEPCQELHIRCWEAEDDCGNVSEPCCHSVMRTVDTEPPVVLCGPDTLVCNEEVVFPDPVVFDNCDPDPIIRAISSVTPGPGPCEETYQMCWEAEDFCGNVSESCCQTIVRIIDEEPPVLRCATMGIIGCNEPVNFIEPIVEDNCDPDPALRIVSTTVTPGLGRCQETHVRCWEAEDFCRNVSEPCCHSVIRIVDEEAPVLTPAPDEELPCNVAVEFTDPEVSDNCDDNPTLRVVSTAVQPGPEECKETHRRCWEAEDFCGNISGLVCQTIVAWWDTIPPTVTCGPDKVIPPGAPIIWDDPVVEDNCPISIGLETLTSLVSSSSDAFQDTTYERCWTIFDDCGNVGQCCQRITVSIEEGICTFGCWDWASSCIEGDNRGISTFPACVRDDHFYDVFPSGVQIGDPARNSALWTHPGALERFECSYGIPKALDRDYVDPVRLGLQGVLAGEVLALRLNREFSCAGYFSGFGFPSCLGSYVIPGEVAKFAGMTVDEFLGVADQALGGDTGVLRAYSANLNHVWLAAAYINWQFSDCGGSDQQESEPPTLTDGYGSDGSSEETSEPLSAAVPERFAVALRPNPIKGGTTISLALPAEGRVSVGIHDVQGRKVTTLLDGHKTAGYHSLTWSGCDADGVPIAPGVYFCRVEVDDRSAIMEKLIKLK